MVYFQLQAEGEEQDGEKASGTPPVESQVGPQVGPELEAQVGRQVELEVGNEVGAEVEPPVEPPVEPDEVPVVPPNDMPPAALPKNRAKPKSPEQEEKENKASLGVILSTWSYTNNILFIFYIIFLIVLYCI